MDEGTEAGGEEMNLSETKQYIAAYHKSKRPHLPITVEMIGIIEDLAARCERAAKFLNTYKDVLVSNMSEEELQREIDALEKGGG